MEKPVCKLIGTDGNVFALIGRVRRVLNEAGQQKEATRMLERCFKARSYDEALQIMMEYVEVQ